MLAVLGLETEVWSLKNSLCFTGIFYEVAEVMQKVVLTCPHIVEGKITWSKERYGMEVDIFTTSNDRSVTDFNEHEGYNSWVGSLLIRNTSTSVSGRYFCDRKPAVELIVPPSGNTAGSSLHTLGTLYSLFRFIYCLHVFIVYMYLLMDTTRIAFVCSTWSSFVV